MCKTKLLPVIYITGNNMYVYMNAPRTLYSLHTNDGYHISTTPLTKEKWEAIEPYKLHVFNNGEKIPLY